MFLFNYITIYLYVLFEWRENTGMSTNVKKEKTLYGVYLFFHMIV